MSDKAVKQVKLLLLHLPLSSLVATQEFAELGLGAYQTAQEQGLQQANQMANLGGLQQQLGLTGAQGVFDMGTQQQQLEQQKLATAYQNFQNQVNWPYQQLNARIAATANQQYTLPTATLAPTSATASNLGAFASLAGSLGSMFGGNS